MTNLQTLATQINAHNFYYNYTENDKVWDKGSRSEKGIRLALDDLATDQLIEVKSMITIEYKHLFHAFGEYFEGLEAKIKKVKKSRKLSRIMSYAWSLFRSGLFTSFRESLTAAWKRYKLVFQLKNGIAYFSFKKATGEIRKAIGTLRTGNFEYQFKGLATDSIKLVKYFDLERQAWRSCRIDRLISLTH